MTLKNLLVLALLVFCGNCLAQASGNPLIQKGWAELVKDNDEQALRYFWLANQKAIKENDTAGKAESYLYLGMCSYGASLEKGLQFARKSMQEYKKLESTDRLKASTGRCKCLQLISTIYSSQKKYDAALQLSREVVSTLEEADSDPATLGLAYRSMGDLYERKKISDSSQVFYVLALGVFEKSNNLAYFPAVYCKLGQLATDKKQKATSLEYFKKAMGIAEASQNRQAQVKALIGLGKWHLEFNDGKAEADILFERARRISEGLSNKSFEINAVEALIDIRKKQSKYREVSLLQQRIIELKDAFFSSESEEIAKKLEIQFELSEMNRKMELLAKQKEVSRLANYLLAIVVLALLLSFFFFRRIYRREKQLLLAKEQLVKALEAQKALEEQQFRNDLEYKESQLSAVAFQMLQKNELLEEIKAIVGRKESGSEAQLSKIIDNHLNSKSNWSDFDKYFESINKNFYTKLKNNYPEISSNDLKMCALIKLNLSIKEMASILNISPDSAKTARYRLRKKLRLNTEDNLTDFILSI